MMLDPERPTEAGTMTTAKQVRDMRRTVLGPYGAEANRGTLADMLRAYADLLESREAKSPAGTMTTEELDDLERRVRSSVFQSTWFSHREVLRLIAHAREASAGAWRPSREEAKAKLTVSVLDASEKAYIDAATKVASRICPESEAAGHASQVNVLLDALYGPPAPAAEEKP